MSAGVTSVHVQAIGAAGHAGPTNNDPYEAGAPGGVGADVTGELPVTPGETLYVEVAGNGLGGGGTSGAGGGEGGGASDVRTVSSTLPESLESRLLVAGGGGGGGGAWDVSSGGRGGNAGADGAAGDDGRFEEGGAGAGGAGTLTGGGAGRRSVRSPERLVGHGRGARARRWRWHGCRARNRWRWLAAAVTGAVVAAKARAIINPFTAGGGGGGSSYAGEDVTSAWFGLASASTEPSVTISDDTPATATPEASSISFPGVQPQSTVSAPQTITLTNTGGTPLELSAETFGDSSPALASDHPEDFLIGSSSCNGAIVFEQTCQLTVRFAPQAPGTSTATLQIDGNMGAGSTTIALSGSGGSLPQGPSGADDKGAQGPAGPQGERGPAGPAAVYECHPREGHGKFATACFVHVAAGSPVGAEGDAEAWWRGLRDRPCDQHRR